MTRTVGHHLEDMIEYGERAVRYLDGRDLAGLLADQLRTDAVARAVEIMGEACKRLPRELTVRYPLLPWKKIARMRDVLIHHYEGLDWQIVWEVAATHVPAALAELRAILATYDAENPPPPEEPTP